MKKGQIQYLIVNAILVVVFNILAFAIPFAHTGTFWACYCFGTLSILCQYPMSAVVFKNGSDAKSQFYGLPVFYVTLLYLVAQLLLSLVGMIVALWVPAWIAVIVFVLLLAATAIGLIAVDAARNELEHQDTKIKKDVSRIRTLQSWSYGMIRQAQDPRVQKEIEHLAEALRYSDPVSNETLAGLESEMVNCMGELQQALSDNDRDSAIAICKKSIALLAERNRLCKLNK